MRYGGRPRFGAVADQIRPCGVWRCGIGEYGKSRRKGPLRGSGGVYVI